jgi:hypothetical protein
MDFSIILGVSMFLILLASFILCMVFSLVIGFLLTYLFGKISDIVYNVVFTQEKI